MDQTKLIRPSSAGELVSAITAMVGYVPTQSLVVIPFVGSRSVSAMRVNLTADEREDRTELISVVLGIACRVPGVTGLAVVAYTNDDSGTHGQLMADLLAAASMLALAVHGPFYVTASTWGEYSDGAAGPAQPLPPLPVRIADGDQNAGADLPARDEAFAAAVAAAEPSRSIQDVTVFYETVVNSTDGWTAETVATLAAHIVSPLYRDVALIQWATDEATGQETLAAQLTHITQAGFKIPAHLAAVMTGEGGRPDPSRLARALEACRYAAAHVSQPYDAALLAGCAWLSWALGNSTHAAFYAQWASNADPGLTLAPLVQQMVDRAILPQWAFAR